MNKMTESSICCQFQIPTDSDSEVGIEILMERMRKLTEEEEETTHEERLKRFEKVESQSVECEYRYYT